MRWRTENWGTKQSADRDSVQKDIYTGFGIIFFATAWGPSELITEALSIKFPELEFTHWYREDNCDFSGYFIWKNGLCLESDEGCIDNFWSYEDEEEN